MIPLLREFDDEKQSIRYNIRSQIQTLDMPFLTSERSRKVGNFVMKNIFLGKGGGGGGGLV